MKQFFALLLCLFALNAHASIAPYSAEEEARLKAIEATAAGGALADGNILVGSSGGLATSVTPSGDITISNTGVTAIGATKVTEAMLAAHATGLNAMRVAHAVWDTAVSSGGVVGAHSLGVALPAKALIKQVWTYAITQPATAASGTVALSCEDANNLLTAADITGYTAGTIHAGNETGTAATMVAAIAAQCNITATIAVGNMSAGKVDVFVEYVVTD